MKYSRMVLAVSLVIAISLVAIIPAQPAQGAPLITVSPSFGAAGTRVTVTGINFDSYKGDSVFIFFNNWEIANSPVIVSDEGGFEVYFDVSDDAVPGAVMVTIKSQTGSVLAEKMFIYRAPRLGWMLIVVLLARL